MRHRSLRFSVPAFDPFIVLLLSAVAVAAAMPARGLAFTVVDYLSTAMIAMLFFLHGLRLPRAAVLEGLGHWRLHLTILAITFLMFPAAVVALQAIAPGLLAEPLWAGLLFLAALPSTVQSSIAFTSIAGGNVAGAVVSAAASNLIGIVATPLIVTLMSHVTGASLSLSGIGRVALLLLLPFVLGQIARRWLSGWADRNRRATAVTDRATIVLAVYVAFSAATNAGLWRALPLLEIAGLAAVSALLLVFVLVASYCVASLSGFSRADRIAIVFCGSKKSLATGVPMAKLLFAGGTVGLAVLPLMIFHQIQLLACAWLARHWARKADTGPLHSGA